MLCSGTRRKSNEQIVQIRHQRSITFDQGKPPNVGKTDVLVRFSIKYSPFKSETCKVPVHVFKDITSLGNTDFDQQD